MPVIVLASDPRNALCATNLAAVEFSTQARRGIITLLQTDDKKASAGLDETSRQIKQHGSRETYLLRHMIRADVEGCGCSCRCDSGFESFPVFERIDVVVGPVGDANSKPSPWPLFFFLAMVCE
jgi:hypothetical protein